MVVVVIVVAAIVVVVLLLLVVVVVNSGISVTTVFFPVLFFHIFAISRSELVLVSPHFSSFFTEITGGPRVDPE